MTEVIFLCAVLGVLLQGVHLSEAEVNNANAKHVTQTPLFGDDIKSWLTPDEGVLATENTPVYGLVKKPKVSVNDTGFQIIEHKDAMKNFIAYLRESKPDAIITPRNKPPKANQDQSTVVENTIPEEPVRRKTLLEINEKVNKMLNMDRRDSNIKCQINPKKSKPYPSIVYPEILVIVDNALYKKLGSNVPDVVTHILAYWNSVDLLFRNLESPKIRLNIKAILIIEDPSTFSQLEYPPGRMSTAQILPTLGLWLYWYQRALPIDSYDIAAFMTSYQMYSPQYDGSKFLGTSYVGGACKTLHELKLIAKIVAVAESHKLITARYMAHEIGKSLGSYYGDHDNQCHPKYGYYSGDDNPNTYEWSQCNLDALTQSFATDNLSCLYNKIKDQGTAVPRLLPGKLFEPNKHCDVLSMNATFIMYQDNCEKFSCKPSDGSPTRTLSEGRLFDGASCGQGKICFLGKCVEENLIN